MENILLRQQLLFIFSMNKAERMIPKPLYMPKAKAALGNNWVKTLWFVTYSHSNQKYITGRANILPSPSAAHPSSPLGIYLDLVFASLPLRGQ